MKRMISTVLLSVIVTLGVLALMGQGRDDWRYGGYISGKIRIKDSLTVEKTSTFRDDMTFSTARLIGAENFAYRTAMTDTVANSATATSDTLWLAQNNANVFHHQIRNTATQNDSVHVVQGLVARQFYLFTAVHTDSTVIFVDGGNLILGGNRTLDGDNDMLLCWSDGTSLIEVAFATNE